MAISANLFGILPGLTGNWIRRTGIEPGLVMYRVGKITRPVGYPAGNWATRTRPDPIFHYPYLPDTRPITRGYPTGNKMTKNNGKNGKICQILPKIP